jgi:hypothetical protein
VSEVACLNGGLYIRLVQTLRIQDLLSSQLIVGQLKSESEVTDSLGL